MTRVADDPLVIADAEARRLSRTCFDRPLVMEAGAGTGKTHTLVGRIVCWCVGPGWERNAAALDSADDGAIAARVTERVAAITFTDRAAAELAERVAGGLTALLQGGTLPDLPERFARLPLEARQSRLRALLSTLDRMPLDTIHAFCRRILARFPLEASLHPYFTVDADGTLLAATTDDVLAEHLAAEYRNADPEADGLALAAGGVTLEQLREAVVSLAAAWTPPEVLAEDPFSAARVRKQTQRLKKGVEPLCRLFPADLPKENRNTRGMLTAIAYVRALAEALSQAEDLAGLQAAVQQGDADAALKRLKKWAKGDFTNTELRTLEDVADAIASSARTVTETLKPLLALTPRRVAVFSAARRTLRDLLETITARLRRSGVLSFDGILVECRRLLQDNAEVRRQVRGSLDLLLVDEFQDTDVRQCAIVEALGLQPDAEDGPGPMLFIVGDPKQSIYGWRRADLASYERTVQQVVEHGGRQLPLCVNHRSVPPILEEVDTAMRPIMCRIEGLQPAFVPLQPSPRNAEADGVMADGRRPVEYWNHWEPPEEDAPPEPVTMSRARELEAAAIARDLVALRRNGELNWGDAALLLRTTSDQDTYLDAFRRAGIPYVVLRDKQYYRRREVIDTAALLRVILDPHDQLALLTVLRAPFSGVPDAALLPLWQRDLPRLVQELDGTDARQLTRIRKLLQTVAGALPQDLPGIKRVSRWHYSATAVLEAIAALRLSFRTQPADVFIEELRRRLRVEELDAARYLGAHRLANVEQLFRRFLQAVQANGGNVEAVLRELRSGVLDTPDESEGQPGDAGIDAVRVMTIHKAKGLTFDHVYLADIQRGRHHGDSSLVSIDEVDGAWEMKLFGVESLNYTAIQQRRAAVESAEMVRTLYVAMTRPRIRLVVSGLWPDKMPGGEAQSHLDLLCRRPQIVDWNALASEADGAEAIRLEKSIRWRIPQATTEVDVWAQSDKAALPDLKRLRRDVASLQQARQAAEQHAARPWSGRASLAGRDGDPQWPATDTDAIVARAVGTAVHHALEQVDLAGDLAKAVATVKAQLPDWLADLDEADRAEALQQSQALLDALPDGRVGQRLRKVAPHVVGREVPVLAAPGPDETPLAGWAGYVDLLVHDDEGWLIVDYKTDRVAGAHVAERLEHHRAQMRIYCRAFTDALGCPARAEIWFLHPDRIVPL